MPCIVLESNLLETPLMLVLVPDYSSTILYDIFTPKHETTCFFFGVFADEDVGSPSAFPKRRSALDKFVVANSDQGNQGDEVGGGRGYQLRR